MRRGRYYDQPPFPFVPGYDLVGRVLATGEGVDPGLAGRRVAALVKVGAVGQPPGARRRGRGPGPGRRDRGGGRDLVVNGITA